MASINTTTISGRLGAAPELRHTQGGDAVTSLRIAVDAGKDETLWLSATVWGKAAENCEKFLDKGSYVVVTGKLVDDSYTNKEGVNINRTAIKAFTVDFGPKLSASGDGSSRQAAPAPAPAPAPQDDLPF